MRLLALVSISAGLLVGCGPVGAAKPAADAPAPGTGAGAKPVAGPAQSAIPRLTGAVGPANAAAFATAVSDNLDKVIGLKVRIAPGEDADFKTSGYLVSTDGDLFALSTSGTEAEGMEIAMPKAEAAMLHGDYAVDGFYVVKSGGMHQGILSYYLEKTDEGVVLTNPAIKVVDRPIG